MYRHLTLTGILFVLLWPLLLAGLSQGENGLQAQPVRISSETDSLRVGQRFDVYFVFENARRNFDAIIFPDSTAFEDPFEFRSAQRSITPEGSDSLRVSLQFFSSDDATLPETTVYAISGTDTTSFPVPELEFFFTSTLAEDANLRPLKPLFDFGRSWWPWILGGLLLLALSGGGYYYWKRYLENRQPEPEHEPYVPPPAFVNPLQELEKEIQDLRRLTRHEIPDTEQIYVKSSAALRRYYRSIYRFPALEYTTREVMRELEKRRLNREYLADVRALLNESDMVKFARFSPDYAQIEAHIEKLENLLNYIRRHDTNLVHQLFMEHAARHRPTPSATTSSTDKQHLSGTASISAQGDGDVADIKHEEHNNEPDSTDNRGGKS